MRKKTLVALRRDVLTTHHTGRGVDRRKDKLDSIAKGIPQWLRRYQKRYGY